MTLLEADTSPNKFDEVPASFNAALKELIFLAGKPGVPAYYADSPLKVIQHLDKLLFVELKTSQAALARDVDCLLQPSDVFMRYMSAFRAGNWPVVRVIEHEILS
jgi:hypothetical protein